MPNVIVAVILGLGAVWSYTPPKDYAPIIIPSAYGNCIIGPAAGVFICAGN